MRYVILAAALAAAATGCTTIDPVTGETVRNNTGTGIIAGATGGAVLGTMAGGNDARNAIVGAIVGGLTGGLIGNYMDQQEARLRDQLRASQIQVAREGDDIILRMPAEVTFDFDRATIKGEFLPTLQEVASTLAEYPRTLVDITGHADSTGRDDYNQTLSENRAFAVGSVLINNGVQRERIVAQGRGESEPIASNATPAGRAQNRRVEIRLTPVRA